LNKLIKTNKNEKTDKNKKRKRRQNVRSHNLSRNRMPRLLLPVRRGMGVRSREKHEIVANLEVLFVHRTGIRLLNLDRHGTSKLQQLPGRSSQPSREPQSHIVSM
ncbi:hypothetical protein L9F63_011371, partial [Diploptera punctata]